MKMYFLSLKGNYKKNIREEQDEGFGASADVEHDRKREKCLDKFNEKVGDFSRYKQFSCYTVFIEAVKWQTPNKTNM